MAKTEMPEKNNNDWLGIIGVGLAQIQIMDMNKLKWVTIATCPDTPAKIEKTWPVNIRICG